MLFDGGDEHARSHLARTGEPGAGGNVEGDLADAEGLMVKTLMPGVWQGTPVFSPSSCPWGM